eukprot:PhM_4_TR17311/c0_g1_i1/m.69422
MGCGASQHLQQQQQQQEGDHHTQEQYTYTTITTGGMCCYSHHHHHGANEDDEGGRVELVRVILDADGYYTKIIGELSEDDARELGLPDATIRALRNPVYIGYQQQQQHQQQQGGIYF